MLRLSSVSLVCRNRIANHVRPRKLVEQDEDPNLAGNTVAHELGHVFTLEHREDVNDVNNLMSPFRHSGRIELDVNQADEIFQEIKKRGTTYLREPEPLPPESESRSGGVIYPVDGFGAILDDFGDVLVTADGKKLERQGDLSKVIQEKEKDDKIKIEFYRDKKTRTVEVVIEEEEGSRLFRFSPEDWEDYSEPWGRSYENILRQQNKLQDDSSREMREQMDRMNREMEIQREKSLDATKLLLKSRKLYKAIRV